MRNADDNEIVDGTHLLDGRAWRGTRFANATLFIDGGPFTFENCGFGPEVRVVFGPSAAPWAALLGTLLGHDGLGPLVAQALNDAGRASKPTIN